MKKLFCILLSCLLCVAFLPLFASAETTNKSLQFNENGEFRIVIFSDIQDNEDVEESTMQLMRETLDKYTADLVIFLGDNSVDRSLDGYAKSVEAFTLPCRERNIPHAFVFGNHDTELDATPEELLDIYKQFGTMTYDADPDLYGCGNCNIPILSSDGTKTAFNLWLIDSGSANPDKETGGYDYVREDQIEWYKTTAAKLKAENGGEVVPAMLFQHIIMPEVYETLYPKLPFTAGKDYTIEGKTYFPVPFFNRHAGIILEPCSPPFVNGGEMDALLETGDVIAAFFGHDHVNDFVTDCYGIAFHNVPTVGCNAYSDAISRGSGLITLYEDDIENFDYETIYHFDMALEEGSLLPQIEGRNSTFYYKLVKFFRQKILDGFHNLFL
ncbi:MAG: metallophosphoesterase family protein [Clostridia bacterium]|nr:metallophosphoesterase family protein [Clostridia bacterium]